MSLRYRLFLSVGLLFIFAFILSAFWENYITKNHLIRAEKSLRIKILGVNEGKRQHLEQFLSLELSEQLAQVNALLKRISKSSRLRTQFEADGEETQNTHWIDAATLLVFNRWIDFFQNTKAVNNVSLIVPSAQAIHKAYRIPIDSSIEWVKINSEENPLIGVRFPIMPKGDKNANSSAKDPSMIHILFSWEQLLNFSEHWQEKIWDVISSSHFSSCFELYWIGDYQPLFQAFFASVEKARLFLKRIVEGSSSKEWEQKIMRAFQDAQKRQPHPAFSGDSSSGCSLAEQMRFDAPIDQTIYKDDEILLIWAYSSIFNSSVFGFNPQSAQSPLGIIRFPENSPFGDGFFAKDVFYNLQLFADREYFDKSEGMAICWNIPQSIAVIIPQLVSKQQGSGPVPGVDQVFLGNTLKLTHVLEGQQKDSYLTLGVNADVALKKLSLAIHEMAFLVHEGKALLAYSEEGKKMPLSEIPPLPIAAMLENLSGVIEWQGKKYFYLQTMPVPQFDLHYFVLSPEDKEFDLITSLDIDTKTLMKSISFNMRTAAVVALFVVLLILHRISRTVTQPISVLAKATHSLKKGHLEEIELPKLKAGRHDEVNTLYNSFAEMVEEIKEKEKVKGVLNKVVSHEIAEEILKGQIHLGGEEKEVTVLFADIRQFTRMTQKMEPVAVIELLNNCMTKISRPIEQYGGVIDKYVGDEIMALFGAPIYKKESAYNAILSSIAIIDVLKTWNEKRKEKNLEPVFMGIGIHTGLVVAGNMGAEDRLNYTVLGSNVNLAARLCSAAQGMQILISKSTWEAPLVKEKVLVEEMPPMQLKGFDEPIAVYSVKGIK